MSSSNAGGRKMAHWELNKRHVSDQGLRGKRRLLVHSVPTIDKEKGSEEKTNQKGL